MSSASTKRKAGEARLKTVSQVAAELTVDKRPRREASVKAKEAISHQASAERLSSSTFTARVGAGSSSGSGSTAIASINGIAGFRKTAGDAIPVVKVDAAFKPTPELYTAPIPKKDGGGRLVFRDHPEFRPNLTPKEILQAGSFGGTYFRTIYSGVTKQLWRDAWREFPADWFAGLDVATQVASSVYRPSVNKHGVSCGQGLEAWESSGWIASCDPFGWFHWYCRFYLGRRCEDDDRQITRWLGIAGPRGRWKNNLVAKCVAVGRAHDDASVSPVVRQTLLHWAYGLTADDYDAYARKLRGGARAPYVSGRVKAAASRGAAATSAAATPGAASK